MVCCLCLDPTTPLPSPESLLECFLLKSKVLNELGEFVEEGDEEDLHVSTRCKDSRQLSAKKAQISNNGAVDSLKRKLIFCRGLC